MMMRMVYKSLRVAAISALFTLGRVAGAQDSLHVLTDTTRVQVIRLRDGSTIVGRALAIRGDSVVIRMETGQVTIARSAVRNVRVRPASSMKAGEYWPEDPNATRLFFAPNARMLRPQEGYFCNIMVFLLCLTGGITDHVTFGGGMSVLPGINVFDNLLYVTPKVGFAAAEDVHIAVGAFAGWAGLVTESRGFGILYGVSTIGDEDRNVTAGLGYAYYDDEIADTPLLLGGLKLRFARAAALISENYLLPNSEGGIISLGIRFFNERISGDVALVNVRISDDNVVVPFAGLAVKFR